MIAIGEPTRVPAQPTRDPALAAVGRVLRLLRIASASSVDDLAIAADLPRRRIRDLEAGRAPLGYGEGLVLAKAYGLCTTCFARQFRGAVARGMEDELAPDDAAPGA